MGQTQLDDASPTREEKEDHSLGSRGRCTPAGRRAVERYRRGAPAHCILDSPCQLGDATLKDNGRDTQRDTRHSQGWGTVELVSPHVLFILTLCPDSQVSLACPGTPDSRTALSVEEHHGRKPEQMGEVGMVPGALSPHGAQLSSRDEMGDQKKMVTL